MIPGVKRNRSIKNMRWRSARSAADGALPARTTLSGQLCGPLLDLGPKPELDAPITELAHRTRHVVVSVLIHADGVAVGEAEEFRDPVRVKEIVDIYLSTHGTADYCSNSDPSEQPDRLQ